MQPKLRGSGCRGAEGDETRPWGTCLRTIQAQEVLDMRKTRRHATNGGRGGVEWQRNQRRPVHGRD